MYRGVIDYRIPLFIFLAALIALLALGVLSYFGLAL